MIRSSLIVLVLSACLLGEQGDSTVVTESLLLDSTSTAYSDTLTVETNIPRKYDYKYQIVSGVAMMLFFGLALGVSQSMNPD